MAREKTNGVYFVMSPEETELFEKRMAQTGIKNRSAFIRKMCIDGHVLIYDSEKINEIGRLLRINTNNVNQMAKQLNSGGSVQNYYLAEAADELTAIRKQFGELLDLLTNVTNAKPGKRFVQPMRFSDVEGRYAEPETAEGGQ